MAKKGKQSGETNEKWRQFAEEMEQKEGIEETEEPVEVVKEEEHHEGLEFPSREKLENQLTAMEKKVDEYKERAVRAHAEMENLRRRAERDITNAHKFGAEKLLIDLLPVVDSLNRALENPESKDPHVKGMREGISLTLELMYKTLSKHGVTLIDPEPGEAFNPEWHEAVSMQQDPNAKSNTVLQVVQKGFQLNGRVLRAAMVIVAS